MIVSHYTEPLTVKDVAAHANINTGYAATIFREHFHITLWEYVLQYRVAHAQRLLATTEMPIAVCAAEAGFTSTSQFYAVFKQITGQTQKQYYVSVREQ